MGGEDEPCPLPHGLREIQARAEARRAREPKMPPSGVLPRPAGPRPLGLSSPQAVLQDHYPAAKQMPQPKRKQQGA
jgi:hypothetical protein